MPKKYAKGLVPPCPGNRADYTLVDRRGYNYWRLKRGTIKPAGINDSLRQRSEAMKALSPTIRYLRHILIPLMKPLPHGELHSNLFKWLQGSWLENGRIDYSGMQGKELHSTHTLHKILLGGYRPQITTDSISISLMQRKEVFSKPGPLVTQFALQATLIWETGDAIREESRYSPIYDIKTGIDNECVFEFKVPAAVPWMAILKLVSFEGKVTAYHPKYFGMRVLATGG